MSTLLSLANSFDAIAASFWRPLALFGPYTPLVALMVLGMTSLSLSRLALMLWQRERVTATGMWGQALLQGLRVDAIQLGLLCLIPALLAPLAAIPGAWHWWQGFTLIWIVASMTFLLFLEAATPGFIVEYDVRPNRLFVEYLKYPKEVCSMLWKGFRIHVFFGLLVTALAVWGVSRFSQSWLSQPASWGILAILLAWLPVLALLAAVIRSSTGHRPANPAMFAITTDSLVNSLILDSAWSVLHAIYNLKHEKTSGDIYGKMPAQEMLDEVNATRGAGQSAPGDDIPTRTRLTPSRKRQRPLNLVIVLEESLGATFVESLGGIPVTPELEKLKQHGWWFEQMFATGTRSVRGIEAVVAGYPPTPSQSVVKLSLSQSNFFCLASLLARHGYHTEFIYGGESHFDNMNGFFRGNGFQSVIDQKDFTAPKFVSSWGVSDEDLFDKTHERLLEHHARGESFFTLAFSSSNHAPFEIPEGRIELYDSKLATENNAVKYADYALGRFFGQARNSPYWDDTLFLVVADHDIRVRGETLVPVKNFHIPALILGADIEPRRVTTVASQIDLPVTALSLMGISDEHPMIGRDISSESPETPGRAMMQFEQNYAWMEGHEVVVLRPGKPPIPGSYNPATKQLQADPGATADAALARHALAHVLLPSWLYREQKYRLPPRDAA
ncbi:MAG TPA: LTA synthase family protein [Methylophilaceae bacterium]|nr:LTA synthase family protein [Methylophilaceae bacterium]